MASVFTQSMVGLAAGKIFYGKKLPRRFWVLSFIYPSLPDADVISFALDTPYEHTLGHRGITHSIIFATVLGFLTAKFLFRDLALSQKKGLILTTYFALITASHGFLDGLTNGGMGIAYLAPFNNTRYFLPFRPIDISPISISALFEESWFQVISNEIIWVWIPVLTIFLMIKALKSFKKIS